MSEEEDLAQNLKEMMRARGFQNTNSQEEGITFENFEGVTIFVFSAPIVKLNTAKLNEIISFMTKMKVKNAIVVYIGITSSVLTTVEKLAIEKTIELFKVEDLKINITKHRLVSKHMSVSSEELVEIKKKIDITKLPVLLTTDPMCKYYAFRKGSVIKIQRKDSMMYRIVK